MKKENTEVTGADPKEIIANLKEKMSKTVILRCLKLYPIIRHSVTQSFHSITLF